MGKDIEWTNVFVGIKFFGEIKLKSFQTNILYRILVTLDSEGHGRRSRTMYAIFV